MSGIDPSALLKVISDLQTRNAALEREIADRDVQIAQLKAPKEAQHG